MSGVRINACTASHNSSTALGLKIRARTPALTALNVLSLEPDAVKDTLGVLLKYQEDVAKVMDGDAARILDELRAAAIIKLGIF